MNILTIRAYISSQPNASRAYLYIAVGKLKSQKLCCCATPSSLPHRCRNNLSHTGDSLSLSLSLSLSPPVGDLGPLICVAIIVPWALAPHP